MREDNKAFFFVWKYSIVVPIANSKNRKLEKYLQNSNKFAICKQL